LYGDLTASENLAFYGQLYDVSLPRREQVLELVGLKNRRNDLVRTFSRGMQQRLAIGRAILHSPRILLLDEPHTGLDQDAGEILDKVLRDVALEGRTIVMTSHDLARAADLATRLAILSKGKIRASYHKNQYQNADLVSIYRDALGGKEVLK
jgi:heme exporter protein A